MNINTKILPACEALVYDKLKSLQNRISIHNLLWIFTTKDKFDSTVLDTFRHVLSMGYTFKDKRIKVFTSKLDGVDLISNLLYLDRQ